VPSIGNAAAIDAVAPFANRQVPEKSAVCCPAVAAVTIATTPSTVITRIRISSLGE
jgi:hypothetical protein